MRMGAKALIRLNTVFVNHSQITIALKFKIDVLAKTKAMVGL
jgi:hypothetical protein